MSLFFINVAMNGDVAPGQRSDQVLNAVTATPKIVQPTTPKGRRTRIHILDCARRVFARAGYVTLRMSDVAEEAGVSMGALYRYFQNKDDLFDNLIGDIHEELFEASAAQSHDFASHPFQALVESNRGYLAHYYDNLDVMRAFIEATTVDERFRDVWWRMRTRHVERFLHALKKTHGIEQVDGVPARRITEAMVAMVEQCAYVWFAQEAMDEQAMSVDMAAEVVAGTWFRAFFDTRPRI